MNGVLGGVLKTSPKARWDPDTAPPEFEGEFEDDGVEDEIVAPVDEFVVEPTDDAFKVAARFGGWKLVSGDEKIPPLTDH